MKKKKPMKKAIYRDIKQMNREKGKNYGARSCLIIGAIFIVVAIDKMTRLKSTEASGAVAYNTGISFYSGVNLFVGFILLIVGFVLWVQNRKK